MAVEPASCPKLTRGAFRYDFGDVAGYTPPDPDVHAGARLPAFGHPRRRTALPRCGGHRQPVAQGRVRRSLRHSADRDARRRHLVAKTEGIIPAPESTHAIAAAVREALQAREEGREKTILFNLSGNGVIDLYAYEQYLSGALKDYTPTDAEIRRSLDRIA